MPSPSTKQSMFRRHYQSKSCSHGESTLQTAFSAAIVPKKDIHSHQYTDLVPATSKGETVTAISIPTQCQQHPKERQSLPLYVYRPRRGRVPSNVSDNTTHNAYRQWKASSHSRACLLCLFRFSCCTMSELLPTGVTTCRHGMGVGGLGAQVCVWRYNYC